MLKTYYCVTTTFYDNGKVYANIEEVYAERQPEDTFRPTRRCDIYEDYFDNREAAKQCAEYARKA